MQQLSEKDWSHILRKESVFYHQLEPFATIWRAERLEIVKQRSFRIMPDQNIASEQIQKKFNDSSLVVYKL